MQKLFDFNENVNENKHTWAENIVKEICTEAKKENTKIVKNGKELSVFPHLDKNNEFRNRRGNINEACKLINDLYTGRFIKDNSVNTLFGNINKKYLEFKKTDIAVQRIMELRGNKEGIRKFLLRCAKNYFTAVKPGQDTYQFIKSAFPVTIKDFILFNDYKGNRVANFLLFYSSTMSARDKQTHDTKMRIKGFVSESVFDDLLNYETYVLENQIQSYWLNVNKLVKEIKSIIKNEETSYSMASCFDIVFKKVNEISEYHKKVLPGYFDPEQQTASDAITEMRDK